MNSNSQLLVTNSSSTTSYTYDSLGNQIRVDYPNSAYTEYTYNPYRNWLTSVVNRNSNDTVLSSFDYNTYDNVGNRTQMTENSGQMTEATINYTYDEIYQLASETRTGSNAYSISYTYDNVGNRLSMNKTVNSTLVTVNYVYNANNQLFTETVNSDTTTLYSYDNNGNLILKTDGLNTTTYAWDYENRLVTINSPLSTINYSYDGDGNRISKTTDSVKTKYINDIALPLVQVLMETNESDTVLATYTYGNDLISRVTSHPSPVTSYYHYDGLGTVRQLTDDTEAVVASYTLTTPSAI